MLVFIHYSNFVDYLCVWGVCVCIFAGTLFEQLFDHLNFHVHVPQDLIQSTSEKLLGRK